MNKDEEKIRKVIGKMNERITYKNPYFEYKSTSSNIKLVKYISTFFCFLLFVSFAIFVYTCSTFIYIHHTEDKEITLKEVQTNEIQCIANNGTFEVNIKTISDKESNKTIYEDYNCWFQDAEEDQESISSDDDTPVTAGGLPSMSGVPGGPF